MCLLGSLRGTALPSYTRTVIIDPQKGAVSRAYSELPVRGMIHRRLSPPSSLKMGRIVKVRLFKDYYYVMDESRTLFIFNDKGEYLNCIGRNKPYPLLRPYDFDVDKPTLSLLVLDESGELYYLTPGGEYMKQRTLRVLNELLSTCPSNKNVTTEDLALIAGTYGDRVWAPRRELTYDPSVRGFLIARGGPSKDMLAPWYRVVFGNNQAHVYNNQVSRVVCYDSDETLYVDFVYEGEKYCFFMDKLTESSFLYRPKTADDCLLDTDGHRYIFVSYQPGGAPCIHNLRINWSPQAPDKSNPYRRWFLIVAFSLSALLVLAVVIFILLFWRNRRMQERPGTPPPEAEKEQPRQESSAGESQAVRKEHLEELQAQLAKVAAAWQEADLVRDNGRRYADSCRKLLHMESPQSFRKFLDNRLDGFMSRLSMSYPQLGQNDLQLCGLLLLGLDKRQIAWIKNLKYESVYTSRQRLAGRMNLRSTSELLPALQQLYIS